MGGQLGREGTLLFGAVLGRWWFVRIPFARSEAEGDIPAMLDGLSQLMDIIPCEDAPDRDVKLPVVNEAISDFVNRFP